LSRPDRTLADFQRQTGFLFSSESAEELIQVINDSHLPSSFMRERVNIGVLAYIASLHHSFTPNLSGFHIAV
jgi:hypothetical protein